MRSLQADDLILEPQLAAHAAEMFPLLADPEIARYLDSDPPSDLAWLTTRFAKLETRLSADGREHWLNWVIRAPQVGLAGYVQATVYTDGSADIAYELGRAFWGRGWASRSTLAMLHELGHGYGVQRAFATVDARNLRSVLLLERLGFTASHPPRHPHYTVDEGDRLFVREPLFPASAPAG
jgi:[ribosomal protein S5]-alanine N-acetyltransferase